jgi:tetratricopeptide (TPR) repeat protein
MDDIKGNRAHQVKSMQPELKVRKILGRTYLNENRLPEALDIFIKILMDYPDDLETLLILGGFYLAGGDGKTAKSIFLRAQQLDPENKTIERQIAMAEEMQIGDAAEPAPTDLEAVTRLLQRLTGQTKVINENDITQAATLLDKIINSDNPADLVSRHLDEIDDLLLALIECKHTSGTPMVVSK